MREVAMLPDENLIESFSVQDVYCDGIGDVENLGNGVFRTIYFTYTRTPGSNVLERVVCAKIIRPTASLLNPEGMMAQWVARQRRRAELILDA